MADTGCNKILTVVQIRVMGFYWNSALTWHDHPMAHGYPENKIMKGQLIHNRQESKKFN